MEKRYTVKKNGKYWSGQGTQRGFLAHGPAGAYVYPLELAKVLASTEGGEVVEVVNTGGYNFEERPVTP